MKRSKIKPISDKGREEMILRGKLRMGLADEYGEHCMTCKDKNRDWRGISLSHIIPLSRGGKTVRKNCLLECYPCHEKYEKRPELREKIKLLEGK